MSSPTEEELPSKPLKRLPHIITAIPDDDPTRTSEEGQSVGETPLNPIDDIFSPPRIADGIRVLVSNDLDILIEPSEHESIAVAPGPSLLLSDREQSGETSLYQTSQMHRPASVVRGRSRSDAGGQDSTTNSAYPETPNNDIRRLTREISAPSPVIPGQYGTVSPNHYVTINFYDFLSDQSAVVPRSAIPQDIPAHQLLLYAVKT
ncbi:hypothetical protein BXZ70DRAFT_909195 [Cristinia sonorae]|uniref:Uncharacterized protein n=1 Tax=Cristinia sonorae TaxID=1940300 RepID=A0A8K0XMH6_9AGAR|nr:hypothetical protein BXZ70DRAFT_909195 [Cristinia sonorae]